MGRKLLIDVRQLNAAQRSAIADMASAHGFEAIFSSSDAEALEAAREAEVIFGANQALIGAAKALKWLSVPSAGTEQYQTALRDRPGVTLTSSSGAYGVTISEHVVMVTLEMMRRQAEYRRVLAERGWLRTLPIHSIRGSRITLLGTGDIGRECALRFKAFGPECVVGVNRSGRGDLSVFDVIRPVDELDAVLPETDLLVMSLPNTDETGGLMDDAKLRLLPEDAFIVNVGRGQSLDQRAIVAQLREGRFSGAALDVFEQEPIPKDDPLWDCPRLLITPHVAGNMTLPYTVARIAALFMENFEAYCAGKPLKRVVNEARRY